MNNFVSVDQNPMHAGIERMQAAYAHFDNLRGHSGNARQLLTLLLVAVVAAALLVADVLLSNWSESSLLAAWVVLCAAVFAGMALNAGPIGSTFSRLGAAWARAADRRAAARDDARFLASAQQDPRVMADLRAAMSRHGVEAMV